MAEPRVLRTRTPVESARWLLDRIDGMDPAVAVLALVQNTQRLLGEIEQLGEALDYEHASEKRLIARATCAEAERDRALAVVHAAEAWAGHVALWGGLRKAPGNIAGAAELLAAVTVYRERPTNEGSGT